MTTRTKIAHDGILYDVVSTHTIIDMQQDGIYSLAELLASNDIVATHGVRSIKLAIAWRTL